MSDKTNLGTDRVTVAGRRGAAVDMLVEQIERIDHATQELRVARGEHREPGCIFGLGTLLFHIQEAKRLLRYFRQMEKS